MADALTILVGWFAVATFVAFCWALFRAGTRAGYSARRVEEANERLAAASERAQEAIEGAEEAAERGRRLGF